MLNSDYLNYGDEPIKIKTLLTAIAVAEISAGAGLLIVPSILADLLFGQPLDSGVALAVGRLAGLALIAIGLSAWLEKSNNDGNSPRSQLIGLLVYNGAVSVLLIFCFFVQGINGILLWPAVAAHLAFAVFLISSLRQGSSTQ